MIVRPVGNTARSELLLHDVAFQSFVPGFNGVFHVKCSCNYIYIGGRAIVLHNPEVLKQRVCLIAF